ncbi:MAG: hypothetical protein ACT6RZ_11075 [Methylophilus sp.]|uniref:hypothetical protein n=1 Tax=Methylophilus sp. TaxID=29541 RepID=UPI0040358485
MHSERWREYLKEKNLPAFEYVCLAAEKMIEAFCLNYDYEGPPIEIYLSANDVFNAHSQTDGKIVVTHGVFNEIEKINQNIPLFFSSDAMRENTSVSMFLWIIAHEFFHFARSHHEARHVKIGYIDALEYDADLFAIAGTFRHINNILKGNHPEIPQIESKKFLLLGVFIYLREFIEKQIPNYNQSHKPFYIRLWWVMFKLSSIDTINPVTYEETETSIFEFQELFDLILNAEKRYITAKSLSDSKLLEHYTDPSTTVKPYVEQVHSKWEQIEPIVKSLQKISDGIQLPNPNKRTT